MHFLLLALLSLPVYASDFAGTWTGEAGSITINADNSYHARLDVQMEQEFVDELANLTQLANSGRTDEEQLVPITEMWIDAWGQFNAQGDTLVFSVNRHEITTNAGPMQEAFTELAWALAGVLADQAGISDEDRAAFEQDFVDNFLGLAEDGIGESPEMLIGHFDSSRDAMVIDGYEFMRAATSVQRQSWGQIKLKNR